MRACERCGAMGRIRWVASRENLGCNRCYPQTCRGNTRHMREVKAAYADEDTWRLLLSCGHAQHMGLVSSRPLDLTQKRVRCSRCAGRGLDFNFTWRFTKLIFDPPPKPERVKGPSAVAANHPL